MAGLPEHQFQPPVVVLDQRAAAFDPVAVVAVQRAVDVADFGVVDVAAHHAVIAAPARLGGHGAFKVADVVHRLLHLVLQVARQRPVRQAQARAKAVEVAVELEHHLVRVVAHIGQPLGVLDHAVEVVAMRDPQAPAVHGDVHAVFHHVDAAEVVVQKAARKLVVVARHEDHMAALARAAQQLLHHVVVRLRPVPAAAQLPAVDDVADQIQRFALVFFQKIEQRPRLAARRAQVDVGYENGAEPGSVARHAGLVGVIAAAPGRQRPRRIPVGRARRRRGAIQRRQVATQQVLGGVAQCRVEVHCHGRHRRHAPRKCLR